MCVVCFEWEKGKLTSKEALRNLGEMISVDPSVDANVQHYLEASSKILDSEVPFKDSDSELDKSWHEETHKDE